ncbi:hypothetical protein [Armatimonas sp.]|uniref:hypothetical protein n=1 Tax=Armatimonas sp. TaxID=1872638 RepID=UPI00286BAD1E|nr:hypothetical protein [Armatimonas sp.]
MNTTTQPKRIGTLDARILKSLDLDEAIVATARRPEYAPLLTAREITTAFVDTFASKVAAARTKAAEIETQLATQKSTTVTEDDTRTQLLDAFDEIQSAAAQKYAEDPAQKPKLAAYAIGNGIRRLSRPALEQAAQTALTALATDTLPGITPDKVTAFASALAAWKTHDTTQTATISDKQQARQELNTLLEDLAKSRRTIQRAANAQWPYHKVATRPIRTEFGLPKTRPLKV